MKLLAFLKSPIDILAGMALALLIIVLYLIAIPRKGEDRHD